LLPQLMLVNSGNSLLTEKQI